MIPVVEVFQNLPFYYGCHQIDVIVIIFQFIFPVRVKIWHCRS